MSVDSNREYDEVDFNCGYRKCLLLTYPLGCGHQPPFSLSLFLFIFDRRPFTRIGEHSLGLSFDENKKRLITTQSNEDSFSAKLEVDSFIFTAREMFTIGIADRQTDVI